MPTQSNPGWTGFPLTVIRHIPFAFLSGMTTICVQNIIEILLLGKQFSLYSIVLFNMSVN